MADIFPPPLYVRHFPTPRIAALTAVVAANLLVTTLAPQIPPGKQSMEIPVRRVAMRIPEQAQNLRLTLFALLQPPGRQSFEIPYRGIAPRQRNEDLIRNNLLTIFAPQIPIGKASLEIPYRGVRPRQRNEDLVRNNLLTVYAPQIPIGKSSAEQPVRTIRRIADDPQNLASTLLASVAAPTIPQGQQSFEIPARRPPQRIEDPIRNLLLTTLYPNYVFNEAQVTKRILRTQPQNFDPPNLQTTTLVPVAPPDTTNVFRDLQVVKIVRTQQIQVQDPPNLLNTVLAGAPAAPPFYQTEWPNPRVNPRFREADNPTNLFGSTLNPTIYVGRIALTSSQAARKPRVQPVFDAANTLLVLTTPPPAPEPPFREKTWPNPVRRKYQAPVDQILNYTKQLEFPFRQNEWPNPRRLVNRAPVDEILNYTKLLEVPFSQTDWPNPRPRSNWRESQQTIGHVETNLALKPTHQDDWQNPRRRIYAQPIWFQPDLLSLHQGPVPLTNPLYTYYADAQHFVLIAETLIFTDYSLPQVFVCEAETKPFILTAELKEFGLVAPREDITMEHTKYLAETYVLAMDFVNRLRSGQTPVTGNVTVLDSTGADVSNTLVDTGTITVSGSKVLFTLRPSGGVANNSYKFKIKANTAADVVEQDMNVSVI